MAAEEQHLKSTFGPSVHIYTTVQNGSVRSLVTGAQGDRCLRALGETALGDKVDSFSGVGGATPGAGCAVRRGISGIPSLCQLVRGSGALGELGICGERPGAYPA